MQRPIVIDVPVAQDKDRLAADVVAEHEAEVVVVTEHEAGVVAEVRTITRNDGDQVVAISVVQTITKKTAGPFA